MPLYGKDKEIAAFLQHVDGFVLTSGLDLDPRRLGQGMHAKARPMAPIREEHDRLVVRQVTQKRMPLLAIGAGMQQINVAAGGTLFLHLPEDLPRAMPHFDSTCSGPHRHAVRLQANSRLEEIYGEGEILVNSEHHQAVRQPGSGFRATAHAPDGVIEAIEATDPNWFCIGVQWHPESDTASALDLQLFECFIQAAIRQSQPLALAA
jgi:putative glutamine amidotransferase